MKSKVAIKDLQFGMYVFELDRPWVETPFMFQGFHVRTQQQIDMLKKYCEFVYVDAERSYPDPERLPPAPMPAAARRPAGPLPGTRRIAHVEQVAVEKEFEPARQARALAENVVADAFSAIKSGQVLDAPTVRQAVAKMSESIMRNPDALMLFSALKERGGYFLDRGMNCSIYMIAFTRFLGMEQADIERAGVVGLLQDVGMLQMPESIVQKPGPLTPEEIRLVRTHVARGSESIVASGISAEVAEIAAQHHEREDGSGYPKGLQGSEMHVIGACAGVVDTFCAMTTKRPYADAISPSNVLGIMHKWKDKTFNAWLIEEFIRCIGIFPVGSAVELNSGEVGIVISQNTVRRLQPRVLVVRDAHGNPIQPHKLLDLSRSPKWTGDEIYRIRRTLEYGRADVRPQDMFL